VSKRFPPGRDYGPNIGAKRAAERWEREQITAVHAGTWRDPRKGDVLLSGYGAEWIENRYESGRIKARTADTYASLWKRHIAPTLGSSKLIAITTADVRRWHAGVVQAQSKITAAKSYRLLATMLGTAVEDGLIFTNPCCIKGLGAESSPERPIATVAQVAGLAEAVPADRRALVLIGAWLGLRVGECRGLRRDDVDLLHGTVKVVRQVQRSKRRGGAFVETPKSEAGRRTVHMPPQLVEALTAHLAEHVAADADAWLFTDTARKGNHKAPFEPTVWARTFKGASMKVGLPAGFHFHDLRHTGNTLAATTGASTKELMARFGHSSPRAALIYQHATEDRDQVIAAALGGLWDRGAHESAPTNVRKLTAREAS
jgi:integrase